MYPSPPPGLADPDDARRERADADWREINAKMPKWLHSHPYHDMLGDGLPEDERTWAFDFRVMTPTAWWRVPVQSLVGGLATDARAQYRLHKAVLQQALMSDRRIFGPRDCARHLAILQRHGPRPAHTRAGRAARTLR
jgi:hypothetical protein